jgi:predicted transcriptional regulator
MSMMVDRFGGVASLDLIMNKTGMIADRTVIAATQIVSAWLGAHEIATDALPELIRQVHGSLNVHELNADAVEQKIAAKAEREVVPRRPPAPVVEIRKSVFADRLICLEDGKSFKTLARHLNEVHGMTPEQYRARWDLPATYPMTAPEYSKVRSRLSSAMGQGKRRR